MVRLCATLEVEGEPVPEGGEETDPGAGVINTDIPSGSSNNRRLGQCKRQFYREKEGEIAIELVSKSQQRVLASVMSKTNKHWD